MGLRKALGIILVSTQLVVAVDYNMQSHKAGLGPGELSMKDYFAIVQKRYDKPDHSRLAAVADNTEGTGLRDHLLAGQQQQGADDTAAVVVTKGLHAETLSGSRNTSGCVRRAGVLSCN